ncbi:hypothetical protein IMZ48_45290 [Candidatus Bathyarchaeota archaeon]|nr:hypothetical protein [Candidatus Bathyarchaeota archaeon]
MRQKLNIFICNLVEAMMQQLFATTDRLLAGWAGNGAVCCGLVGHGGN